jgi:hypothetical protein
MRYAFAMLFLVHGFAHTVGFVVPWKIATLEEMPYKTTILNGKIDLGHRGIRLTGILWLLAALLFFVAGALVIGRMSAWLPLALGTTLFSLILCVLGLPDSRIGIAVNLVILVFAFLGVSLGWFEALRL